jgi:hypothetical protein
MKPITTSPLERYDIPAVGTRAASRTSEAGQRNYEMECNSQSTILAAGAPGPWSEHTSLREKGPEFQQRLFRILLRKEVSPFYGAALSVHRILPPERQRT